MSILLLSLFKYRWINCLLLCSFYFIFLLLTFLYFLSPFFFLFLYLVFTLLLDFFFIYSKPIRIHAIPEGLTPTRTKCFSKITEIFCQWMLFWLATSLRQSNHSELKQRVYNGGKRSIVMVWRFVNLMLIFWKHWLWIQMCISVAKQRQLLLNGPLYTYWHFTMETQSKEKEIRAYGTVWTMTCYLR